MENQKGFIPILLIVLIAIVVGGGSYYAVKKNQEKKVENSIAKDEKKEENKNTTIDTSGWKTHTIKNYQFSYPSEWTVSIKENGAIFTSSGTQMASILCPIKEVGYEAWTLESQKREVKLLDKSYFVELWDLKDRDRTTAKDFSLILVNRDNFQQSCEMSISAGKKYSTTVAKQIYSSIKFTSPQADTSGWKTYTSAKYGFELKIPSSIQKVETNDSDYDQFSYCDGKIVNSPEIGKHCVGAEYKIGINVYNEQFNSAQLSKYYESPLLPRILKKYSINGHDFYIGENHATTYRAWLAHTNLGNRTLGITFSGNAYVFSGSDVPSPEELSKMTSILSTLKFTSPLADTSGWKRYDSGRGFEFKYPTSLTGVSLLPMKVFTTNNNIDGKGCYTLPETILGSTSRVTINNVPFCLSTGGDAGAGQAGHYYYYATPKNGEYLVIGYALTTSNGCGAIMGEPGYPACVDFFENFDTLVVQKIRDSIGTFRFFQ
jgi:hypothetical protein